MAVRPEVSRLKSQLAITGLQKENNRLFQVLDGIIKALEQALTATEEEIVSVGGGVSSLADKDFLTHSDESATLANSRRLLAGTGIAFDDTVANQRTINNISTGSDWDVLTDGDLIEPELIFAAGEVIMLEIP